LTFKEFKEAVVKIFPDVVLHYLFINRHDIDIPLEDSKTLLEMELEHEDTINEFTGVEVID